MIMVHLKDGDDTLTCMDLEVLPRVGDNLSFEAKPNPGYWSPEAEANHLRLSQGLWVVVSVCHFLRQESALHNIGCYQFVNIYLARA